MNLSLHLWICQTILTHQQTLPQGSHLGIPITIISMPTQFVTLAVSTHEHPRNIQRANRPDFSSLLYGPTLNYWSAFLLKRNIHTIHLEWLFTISSTRILYYCFSSNDMFFYLNYWNQVVATQRLTNKTGKTVPPSVHSMVLHKLLKMTWKL